METKLYEIPCSFEMYVRVPVQASSLEEAKELVDNMETRTLIDTFGASYVDDSFQFDEEILEDEYPEEID